MRDQTASRTAIGVAILRAAHQLLDHPRVFDDPLALAIVGAEYESHAREREARPSLRALIAARSRYAEDGLAMAVEAGVRQYVVLGAGLDTFACRNPHVDAGLRVFEVDHPATQEWKREQLGRAGIRVLDHTQFVPVDFERQSLAGELEAAGFRAAEPSFFSCLGVIPYLTEEAFDATFSYIGRTAPASGVVFDYPVPNESLSATDRRRREELSARVASAGEPLRLFFHPEQLAARLRQMGFRRLEDLDADSINARYFADRADGLRVTGASGRLMYAGL